MMSTALHSPTRSKRLGSILLTGGLILGLGAAQVSFAATQSQVVSGAEVAAGADPVESERARATEAGLLALAPMWQNKPGAFSLAAPAGAEALATASISGQAYDFAYFDYYYQNPVCDSTLTTSYADGEVFVAQFAAGPAKSVEIGVTGQAALGSYLDPTSNPASRDSLTISCVIDAGTPAQASCPASGQAIVLHPTQATEPNNGGFRFLGVTFPYAYRTFYANPAWTVGSTHTVTISFKRTRSYTLGANVCGSQLFVRY